MSASGIFHTADLVERSPELLALNPPGRLSVFGDPVAHSKSPGFQNAALQACGIEAQYLKIHVRPAEIETALRALPGAGFLGTNVTIPHKAATLAIVDEADDYARKSGAVNTVVVSGERLLGFNTDGPGLLRAVREEFQAEVRDLRVLVLGAGGGAGRAIAVQCAMERCQRLVLANRTVEKAELLADELASLMSVEAIPNNEEVLEKQLLNIDLVINATSVGMDVTDKPLIPMRLPRPGLMIYDTIYSTGKSRLVQDAETAGARAANGLSMLLHQGALSFEIWFQRSAPLEVMRRALMNA